MADRYEVIGPVPIGGVPPGGTVELDPEQVNIPALVHAGHIRPAPVRRKSQAGGDK